METSEYTVECPKYKLECDIESCPRFLVSTAIEYNKDGELIGSGFCNEHGHRYFKDIPQEKIQFKQTGENSTGGDPEKASATGHSRSSHIGEEFCGVKIDANCEVLHITGEGDFQFKGVEQWKIIDKLVDAWFDNFKKPIIGHKPDVQKIFTSKDGKRLLELIHFETFDETKTKNPGRNSKYTGRAWFIVKRR